MVTTQDYCSLTLIPWCMKLKPRMFLKILVNTKKMFDFSNYWTKSKFYDSKKLVVGKMKDEAASVAIKEFARSQRCIRFW